MKRLLPIILCIAAVSAATAIIIMHTDKQPSVAEVIKQRRSVRAYKDTPVERVKLQTLAELGVAAPSAMNYQEWELRIVDSKEWIDSATKAYLAAVEGTGKADYMLRDPNFKNIFRNAPAVIFVAAPKGDYAGINIGLLGENIMLAAVEMGLGTCCLGSVQGIFAEPALADHLKSLGFSEGYHLAYAIAVGYPNEQPEATPRDLTKIKFVE